MNPISMPKWDFSFHNFISSSDIWKREIFHWNNLLQSYLLSRRAEYLKKRAEMAFSGWEVKMYSLWLLNIIIIYKCLGVVNWWEWSISIICTIPSALLKIHIKWVKHPKGLGPISMHKNAWGDRLVDLSQQW